MKMKNIISAASACLLAAIICLSGCSKSEQQQSSRTEQQESKPASSQASEKKESSSASSEQSSQSSTESSSESSSGNMEYINTITPTIWEVTDKDNNRMFMMGTIHLGDKSVEHMPDYFETAFSQCDALAVECDSSSVKEDLNSVMQYMYTDGTTIKDHVDEEDYYKAVKILKDTGAYIYTYDYVKPFLWISATEVYAGEQAGLNADYGVDNMLQKRALGLHKDPFVDVPESADAGPFLPLHGHGHDCVAVFFVVKYDVFYVAADLIHECSCLYV